MDTKVLFKCVVCDKTCLAVIPEETHVVCSNCSMLYLAEFGSTYEPFKPCHHITIWWTDEQFNKCVEAQNAKTKKDN